MSDALDEQSEAFALAFVQCRDEYRAAQAIGCAQPARDGIRLLTTPAIAARIRELLTLDLETRFGDVVWLLRGIARDTAHPVNARLRAIAQLAQLAGWTRRRPSKVEAIRSSNSVIGDDDQQALMRAVHNPHQPSEPADPEPNDPPQPAGLVRPSTSLGMSGEGTGMSAAGDCNRIDPLIPSLSRAKSRGEVEGRRSVVASHERIADLALAVAPTVHRRKSFRDVLRQPPAVATGPPG